MPYKDPEVRKAYQREYQKKWNAANPEKLRAQRERAKAGIEEWRAANPESVRAWGRKAQEKFREKNRDEIRARDRGYKRKAAYGISPVEYHSMVVSQAGRCGICKQEFAKTPHVDHDHGSGKIRGLLCGTCNVGIAMLRHDPALLANASDYLGENVL